MHPPCPLLLLLDATATRTNLKSVVKHGDVIGVDWLDPEWVDMRCGADRADELLELWLAEQRRYVHTHASPPLHIIFFVSMNQPPRSSLIICITRSLSPMCGGVILHHRVARLMGAATRGDWGASDGVKSGSRRKEAVLRIDVPDFACMDDDADADAPGDDDGTDDDSGDDAE